MLCMATGGRRRQQRARRQARARAQPCVCIRQVGRGDKRAREQKRGTTYAALPLARTLVIFELRVDDGARWPGRCPLAAPLLRLPPAPVQPAGCREEELDGAIPGMLSCMESSIGRPAGGGPVDAGAELSKANSGQT